MKKNIPAKNRKTVRYVALKIIDQVEQQQAYSNLLIKQGIEAAKLNNNDSRLLSELVYGTISCKLTLDYYLSSFIGTKKVDKWVRELLWLSIYQWAYLDRVPDHAIINESVELAKILGNPGIAKFVNGVLRNIQRQGLPEIEEITDPIERLSVEISMPVFLVKKLVQQYGIERVREIGYSLLQPSKVSARVTHKAISKEQVLNELLDENIQLDISSVSPYGIIGEKGFLAGTSVFSKGEIAIQDESSMLVAPSLQIEPHHKVLDACAAPGGKTTHIAEFLSAKAGGKVFALDIHEHKLDLIRSNLERMNLSDVVETMQLDARDVQNNFADEMFDRILVDAPCSGLGLMRRKPDIKYTKSADDFIQLAQIQGDILKSVASRIKVGGILTYSTCTIIEEENELVIEKFLKEHPEFEKIEVSGVAHLTDSYKNKMLQILPDDYGTDGFFICCLRKNMM